MRRTSGSILLAAAAAALAISTLVEQPEPMIEDETVAAAVAPLLPAEAEQLARETRAAALARKAAREAEAAAEPSWQERCQADPDCVSWQEEQRRALADVTPARRAAYRALLASPEAIATVEQRIARNAAALELDEPIHQLFELLSRETALAIEADDCAGAACDRWRAELDAVHADFAARTGITMSEFRAGSREPTREETLAMQEMAERQGGRLYFVREKGTGEVAPRLIGEEEAADLQASADSCPAP